MEGIDLEKLAWKKAVIKKEVTKGVPMWFLRQFREALRALMEKTGLSRREFAKTLGVGAGTVDRWLGDNMDSRQTPRMMNGYSIYRLEKVFGITFSDLVDGGRFVEAENETQGDNLPSAIDDEDYD